MLLPLYVLCYKIKHIYKQILFTPKSPEVLRGFPCSQSGLLVENLLVCGVVSLPHRGTPHTIGAKQLNQGFLCPHVCGLSHFEDLIRFEKSFSVYPLPSITEKGSNVILRLALSKC